MTPVCVVVFFNIFCYSVFPECFFVHVVGGREGVGREKAEHRSLWWERVWEDAPGGSSQHDEGYSQSRNRRESSTAPCCLCCLWRTSQHSRHCGVTFRYKAIVKDVDTKIAQKHKNSTLQNAKPIQLPVLGFSVTEEPQPESPPDTSTKKLPKPMMEKPAKPALERSSRTSNKPAPIDILTKQESEKPNKSPPPPPPRKVCPSSSTGMTTTRSGEVVYTSRKESVSSQVSLQLVGFPTPLIFQHSKKLTYFAFLQSHERICTETIEIFYCIILLLLILWVLW